MGFKEGIYPFKELIKFGVKLIIWLIMFDFVIITPSEQGYPKILWISHP